MTRRSATGSSMLPGIAVLVIALVVRFQYILDAQVDNPLRADAGQYFRIAMNVINYGIFSVANPDAGVPVPDTYRAPGYPLFVALSLVVGGNVDLAYSFALIAQALMGAVTAVLAYQLARRWLNAIWACLAGLIVAVWPHLITQGGYILTESMFGALIVTGIFASVRAVESGRACVYFAAGILLAMGSLTNQVLVLFPLLLFPLMWRQGGRSRAALFVLAAMAPPALWAVRDGMTHPPAAFSAGERLFENVLIGMEPDFNRYYRSTDDALGLAARQRVRQGLDEYVTDRSLAYSQVVARLERDPLHYLGWFAQKPVLLWAWSIGQGAGDIYVYPMITSPFETNIFFRSDAAICHGLNGPVTIAAFSVAILVLAAMWRRRPVPTPLVFCTLVFCYATLVYAVLTPDARYANPFRPFEVVLAVTGAAWLHDRLCAWRSRSSTAAFRQPARLIGQDRVACSAAVAS